MNKVLDRFKWFVYGGIAIVSLAVLIGLHFTFDHAQALQPYANSSQIGASSTPGYVLQTNGNQSTWVATSTLGITGGSTNLPSNGLLGQYLTNTATNTPAWENLPIVTVCPSGETGCTYEGNGTNDQIAINKAIGTGGTRVEIKGGQYTVCGSIVPVGDNVLEGDGEEATHITEGNGCQVDIIAASSTASTQTDFVLIEDMTIDGNYSNNTSGSDTAINEYQALGWVVDFVHTNHSLRGVWINGTASNLALNNTVEDSRLENSQNESLVAGSYAPDNKFYNNNTGPSVAYSCISLQNVEEQVMFNHQANCGLWGIDMTVDGQDNVVGYNFDEHANKSGIYIAPGMQGNTVTNETSFDNCQTQSSYCGGFEDGGTQTTIQDDKSYDDQGSKTQGYALVIDPTATSSIYSENSFQSNTEKSGNYLASSTPTQTAAQTLAANVILTQNFGYSTYGTTTPLQATFGISAAQGINPFQITSSTGLTLFNVAGNGSTTISNLGTGCIAASNGSLYGTGSGCGSGGGSSPAGVSGQVQYNNSGSFGAVATGTPGLFLGNTATNTPGWINPFMITVGASGANFTATGSNDDVGINAALAAAAAQIDGGSVFIKPGTYNAANSINLPTNVSLFCDAGAVINVVQGNGVVASGTVNSTIQGCHFDGSNDNTGAFNGNATILVNNAHNIKLDKNLLTNSYGFGMYIINNGATSTASTSDITITNNTLYCEGSQDCIGGGNSHTGNRSLETSDVIISHNTLIQNDFSGGVENSNMDVNCLDMVGVLREDVDTNNCKGNLVFGNEKYPNTYSKMTNNVVDSPLGPLNVSGEIVIETACNDCTVNASSTPAGDIISGNIIKNGGIYLNGNSGSPFLAPLVEGNTIQVATSSAQEFRSAEDGIQINQANYALVTDNTITSYVSGQSTDGILLQSTTNTTLSNNTINGFATGIDMASTGSNKANVNIFFNVTTKYVNPGTILDSDSSGNLTINNGASYYLASASSTALVKQVFGEEDTSNDIFLLPNAGDSTHPATEIEIGYNSPLAWTFGGSCCGGVNPSAFNFNPTGTSTWTVNGTSVLQIASTGIFVPNGKVGIDTTTAPTTLEVGGTDSTLRIGEGVTNKVGCIELYDSVSSSTLEYLYTVSGTLTATTSKPSFCQ